MDRWRCRSMVDSSIWEARASGPSSCSVSQAGRVVAVDRIVELLWGPDAGDKTSRTVQVYVSNLRRALASAEASSGRALIETVRPGYVVHVPPEAMDVTRFENLVRQADERVAAGDHDAAVGLLRAANALDADRLWPTSVRSCPASPRPSMPRSRPSCIASPRPSWPSAGTARRSTTCGRGVRRIRLDEAMRGRLMLALYRSGHQSEALRVFAEVEAAVRGTRPRAIA